MGSSSSEYDELEKRSLKLVFPLLSYGKHGDALFSEGIWLPHERLLMRSVDNSLPLAKSAVTFLKTLLPLQL